MADKAAALKEKLANLKRKRQEAKTANHRDVCKNNLQAKKMIIRKNTIQVVEEDRVAKLPENFEARKERAEYILNEMNQKKAVEDAGLFLYKL